MIVAGTDRERAIVAKALALALEVYSRAHPRHTPSSDADDMASLYLSFVPSDDERRVYAQGVGWLLRGGLDLRERDFGGLPTGGPPAPEPAPGGGERIAA